MEKAKLTPQQIADISRPIARDLGVTELYLFGSMARGTDTDDSDVDFIYDLPAGPKRYRVVDALRNTLSQSLGRPVDLVRKEYISQPIENNRFSELQRRAFVRDLDKYPMYRIV